MSAFLRLFFSISIASVIPLIFCSTPPPQPKRAVAIIEYTVLWADPSAEAFKQCSRKAPRPRSRFVPTSAQVDTLFGDLRGKRREIEAGLPLPLEQYRFQAIGFDSSLVYLNCFAACRYHGIPDWRAAPVVACGNGGHYWGIVYDIRSRSFSELSINAEK